MILGVHVEVLLALVYTLFLGAVAFLLEVLARRSQRRAADYRLSGFVYFRDLDYFECPAGHQLVQLETDHHRRIKSYRAQASACNSCPLKLNCTDSDEGRVLERRWGTWIDSEIRRFHRGISVTLLLLAALLLMSETYRYAYPQDRQALVLALLPLGIAQFKLLPSLWNGRRQAPLHPLRVRTPPDPEERREYSPRLV
jgi:hypothetical protein